MNKDNIEERFLHLSLLKRGLISQQSAADNLNLSLRHIQRLIKRLKDESKRIPELPLHVCKQCCDCFYLLIDHNYLLSVSNWNSSHVYAIWTSDTSLLNITTFFSDTNVMQK